jgi:transposase
LRIACDRSVRFYTKYRAHGIYSAIEIAIITKFIGRYHQPSTWFAKQDILLVLDGAPNHRCGDLAVPGNITLLFLPPYAPELNPKENLWDEIRKKVFKNYALKSIDAVHLKLNEAISYINRNPKLVKSITSFPYIARSF